MPEQAQTGLVRRVEELRAALAQLDTAVLAQTSGAVVENGSLHLQVWKTAVLLSPPDFVARDAATGRELDPMTQALLAYYLNTADGTPPAHAWIAFTELPDGRFYTRAFQGYTGRELAQVFGNDVERLSETAVSLGGQAVEFAHVAFQFRPLPHVPLLIACWLGDEDFPPSYKILFDAHTPHYLPTDACAILGSMLTRRLLKQRVPDE